MQRSQAAIWYICIYTLAGVIKVNAFLPASEKEQMKAVKLGTDEATT